LTGKKVKACSASGVTRALIFCQRLNSRSRKKREMRSAMRTDKIFSGS
jgi:hypothetical protein